MDAIVSRDILSFTDMNDKGRTPRTYEVGDMEDRGSNGVGHSVRIHSIVVRMFGASAVFTITYADRSRRAVFTSNFSAVTTVLEHEPDLGR